MGNDKKQNVCGCGFLIATLRYIFIASVIQIAIELSGMKRTTKIVMKINDDNENHHLWNNRGIWWCHVTVHKPDATSERMRFSLKTKDVDKARERRDRIFKKIAEIYDIAA
jgi:hypothetical protein